MRRLAGKFKRQGKILTGRTTPIRPELSCRHEWYGDGYGGFYVHPDNLNSDSIVYSFGIGEDVSFDLSVIQRHHCRVFGFDPTPKSIQWVTGQQLPPQFTFLQYGIHSRTGFVNFNLPKNEVHVSGSILNHKKVDKDRVVLVPMKSFEDINTELGHSHLDLLKMDIEGSEYDVIAHVLSAPVEIDQILIELHERFFIDGKDRTRRLLKCLRDNGYAIFAVSDSMEEVSFIRKESIHQ
jgi:FkbM family methyltransferase